MLNEDGRRLLLPLFGAVALVFVIACANVAGLLLARGLHRQRDYVLRTALGATWQRLFRQVLTESVALALVGAVVGAGFAVVMVALFLAVGAHALPRADAVAIGWPVFAFCVVGRPDRGGHRRTAARCTSRLRSSLAGASRIPAPRRDRPSGA